MGDFPDTVGKAVKAAVPCARPFTGIELLQLIHHDDVKRYGLFRRKPVFADPEINAKTLIDFVDDDVVKGKLKLLVANAAVQYIRASDVTQSDTFISARSHVSNPPQASDLARIGLKAASDHNWSLSFSNGLITKRSVSELVLSKFLKTNEVRRSGFADKCKALVTAIYFVTGGLTYTGDANLVTTGEAPNASADVLTGWHCTTTDDGYVVLSEIDPKEWIIAIECTKLEEQKEEEEEESNRMMVMTKLRTVVGGFAHRKHGLPVGQPSFD